MNKFFGKSRKSKEKLKQREERREEDDILFGRKNSRERGGLSRSMVSTSSTASMAMTAPCTLSHNGESKRNTYPSSIAEGKPPSISEGTEIGDSNESRNSYSTSYYRGDSSEAVSGTRRNDVSGSSHSNPELSKPAAARPGLSGEDHHHNIQNDNGRGNNRNDDWETPQAPPAGGGKTSGMSQEELDNLTKRRLRDERRKTRDRGDRNKRSGNRGSFDDRLKGSLREGMDGIGDVDMGLNDDAEEGEHGRKPRHGHGHRHSGRRDGRHRKSERKHRRSTRTKSIEEEDDGGEPRSDAVPASGVKGSENGDDDDEVEQRRRRRREQDENDRRLKASVRAQRDAARNMRAGPRPAAAAGSKSYGDDVDDEVEQRRRRQREQEENDRRLKASVREQRDAARNLRASTRPGAAAAASSKSYGDDVDDEVEQRRRRQREQEENDRKLKASVREQRDAARNLRASAQIGRSGVDDELEDRRRRQREQEENDRRLKASVRQQRDAARDLRASAQIGAQASALPTVDEGFEERQRRRRERQESDRKQAAAYGGNGHGQDRHVSFERGGFDREDSLNQDDSFETALNKGGGLMLQKKEEEADEQTMQQNLIDLHIQQFRATSKANEDDEEDYDEFDVVDPVGTLAEFEEKEFELNSKRRMSRRISATTMKINAWHQKYTLKKALELAERSPEMEWASSFYRCDPRWQIMKFFDEVAREGGEAPMDENLAASPLANLFNKANVFTVWRPTSDEAIKNMMLGIATGKGLDIKGKSAKRGNISSYVPFIQIYEEPHKEHVRALIRDGRTIRVFYQSEEARNEAHGMILDIKDFMLFAAEDAMRVLSDEYADPEEQELAMKHLMYDDTNLSVKFVDTYINSSPPVFGLDITERLFWESYVMMQDCSRPAGTDWDIKRGSEPTFMDMNFKAIRHEPAPGDPRAVVYQYSKCSPMEPRTLLMAYEEYGRVKPVVSDFDCFLLGSRGVKYENPIPPDQVELVKWSVENIKSVLDERAASDSKAGWMETWFKVLKKAALKGFYPKTPKYGNGDPKSYEIIEVAVSRLQGTGCVRHGAECFNWFFPQEIDEQLLVISDTLPGNVKWKKVNPAELQEILIEKIDEGFTFPINPKWVLCDPGWRRVYDKLLASRKPNVQDSINCWLPPETGLREEIDRISKRHPLGFEGTYGGTEGTEVMDQMQDDLERYLKIQRAWRKLRLLLYWIRFTREKRREREERERAAQLDRQW